MTKYDPTDWNDEGRYVGPEDEVSDHGPVEAAYLAAAAAFADESGINQLAVRDPEVSTFVNFHLEAPIEGEGLIGLFAPDLSDYYDGAIVPLSVGLELIRVMLRANGAWCCLEVENRFLIHIGFDQYMYVGSALPCEKALRKVTELGLFAVRIERSPWDFDDDDGPARPADPAFWAEFAGLVANRGTVLLQESQVRNRSRWHRVTAEDIEEVRLLLAPRSCLLVWPDLSTDPRSVLAEASKLDLFELIWQDKERRITNRVFQQPDPAQLPADIQAASLYPPTEDDAHPLLAAVLPDPDGVLRARWLP